MWGHLPVNTACETRPAGQNDLLAGNSAGLHLVLRAGVTESTARPVLPRPLSSRSCGTGEQRGLAVAPAPTPAAFGDPGGNGHVYSIVNNLANSSTEQEQWCSYGGAIAKFKHLVLRIPIL